MADEPGSERPAGDRLAGEHAGEEQCWPCVVVSEERPGVGLISEVAQQAGKAWRQDERMLADGQVGVGAASLQLIGGEVAKPFGG